jgi:hypothetical protein
VATGALFAACPCARLAKLHLAGVLAPFRLGKDTAAQIFSVEILASFVRNHADFQTLLNHADFQTLPRGAGSRRTLRKRRRLHL